MTHRSGLEKARLSIATSVVRIDHASKDRKLSHPVRELFRRTLIERVGDDRCGDRVWARLHHSIS